MAQPLIDETLKTLSAELKGFWPRRKRILTEVADHLHEAAQLHEARGLSRLEAERLAVADFGAPKDIALHFTRERVSGAVRAAFIGLGATMLMLLMSWNLERLFPAVPTFHSSVANPVWPQLEVAAVAATLIGVALSITAWAFRSRPRAVNNLLGIGFALVVAGVCGLHAQGLALSNIEMLGAANQAPLLIRTCMALVAIPFSLRLHFALDSLKRVAPSA